jgi:hypothetical protein
MHPSHATFICREEHRQELLAFARQQALVRLTRAGTSDIAPREAIAMAVLAFVHRVTAYMLLALRARPSTRSDATIADSPQPFVARRG